ncbi:MAG: hypothetical protein GY717_16500 [Rhodobacteraceae bacterium]|nr:hypothetical protein [Paracoccaceae bacterium]
MAYLDPQTLTGVGCGNSAEVTWIVGEGPNSKPGEGPAYISALDDGHWSVETQGAAVTILCPDCSTRVAGRGP